jgi:hypothetical protein
MINKITAVRELEDIKTIEAMTESNANMDACYCLNVVHKILRNRINTLNTPFIER